MNQEFEAMTEEDSEKRLAAYSEAVSEKEADMHYGNSMFPS